MVAKTFSRAQLGVEAPLITVEAHMNQGLPQILIVGLPETAVRESKDRVRAAIANSGWTLPGNKATVNLAPADLPKQGGRYDLAIACSLLEAAGVIRQGCLSGVELLGELALDGSLRPVKGVLPATIAGADSGRTLIVPRQNGAEAAMVASCHVRVSHSLLETVTYIQGKGALDVPEQAPLGAPGPMPLLNDIRGQHLAKRALAIAAAGSHNLLFIGPPGTGKTMLAARLPALLPALSQKEALELAAIQSVSRYGFDPTAWERRPFRSPHHTASPVALVGGGNPPRPGEISLAHQGILFLDELPEFARSVLEVLREPVESGRIIISRANHQVTYPSRFQLVAAMNPCPCGYFADDSSRCTCGIDQVLKYRGKVSGPLMDRIDLHVDVPPLPPGVLSDPAFEPDDSEHHEAVVSIRAARDRMYNRQGKLNAHLDSRETQRDCRLSGADQRHLDKAMLSMGLSARGYYKIMRVARTIADLSGSDSVDTPHLSEAIGYRRLDRYRPGEATLQRQPYNRPSPSTHHLNK